MLVHFFSFLILSKVSRCLGEERQSNRQNQKGIRIENVRMQSRKTSNVRLRRPKAQ